MHSRAVLEAKDFRETLDCFWQYSARYVSIIITPKNSLSVCMSYMSSCRAQGVRSVAYETI